ncbi:MAG: hypothetical protein V4702_06220 [Patescibacteria group bacterium]
MRKESAVRRFGVVMLALTMFVQMFAVVSPPDYSLAASPNDIIYGGTQTSGDLIDAWQRNAGGDVQAIFAYYGVGIQELSQMQDASVDTRGDNVNRYYSIGRTIGGRTDSFEVPIPGATTPIYMRTLGGWAEKEWPAFSVPSSKFGRIWILKDCGNIVTEGIPPTGTPGLNITKLAEPGHDSNVNPGDRIHYTLVFSNKGSAPAQNFYVQDHIPATVDNIEIGTSGAFEYVTGKTFTAYWDELPKPSVLGNHPTLEYQVNFWVTVNANATPGRYCNQAQASAVDASVYSNEVCYIIKECPYNPGVALGSPSCQRPGPSPPVVTAMCVNGTTGATISWNESGLGQGGYVVDISTAPDFNGNFWNKATGAAVSTDAPAGFNGSGGAFYFTPGSTYYIRVWYAGPDVHSQTAVYTANPCDTPPPPPPPVTPQAACTLLNARYLTRTSVEFEALATSSDGATISAFEFDTGANKKATVPTTTTSGSVSAKFTHDYPGTPAPASYNAKVTAITSLGNKTAESCTHKIEIQKEKLPLVTVEKTTGTTTQKQSSRIKVNPGEEFSFNFTVKNLGDAVAKDYVLPNDNINDILEYADLVSSGDAEVIKKTNQGSYLQWKPLTIQAGETIVKKISFKLKTDLPKTNTPPSNPKSYDCQIENTISSSTTIIDIDKSHCIVKVLEKASTTLPNTGPGTSLAIGFGLTTFVAYFFARTKLFATELEIVREDFATSGGI